MCWTWRGSQKRGTRFGCRCVAAATCFISSLQYLVSNLLGADFRAWLLGNSKQPKMTIDEDRLSQVFGLLLHFPHRDSRSHQKQLHEFSSKASLWEKFPSRSLPKKTSIRRIDCSEFRKNDKQDVAECFLLEWKCRKNMALCRNFVSKPLYSAPYVPRVEAEIFSLTSFYDSS